MFYPEPLNGSSLPDRTLCLTFDDGPCETNGEGPGPKTLRIAEFLHKENIFATFFMVGSYIKKNPHLIERVVELGHLVGNHTYNHHDVHLLRPNIIVNELETTDAVIRDYLPDNKVYFRSPYGSWNRRISDLLNRELKNDLEHFGPYGWDIDCHDWSCWRDGVSLEECADRYLDEINKIGRGIILMHDSTADLERIRVLNKTYEMIRILIPRLKSQGYHFVRLDEFD
jgi:peptidoglycan/xylan/chitin deacetylase (PgdA/CDA1 family)